MAQSHIPEEKYVEKLLPFFKIVIVVAVMSSLTIHLACQAHRRTCAVLCFIMCLVDGFQYAECYGRRAWHIVLALYRTLKICLNQKSILF